MPAAQADLALALVLRLLSADGLRALRAAALAQDELSAQLSRTHNDANVLCLSADLTGTTLAKRIVDTFMKTNFEGGRHERRISKIREIEDGRAPTK